MALQRPLELGPLTRYEEAISYRGNSVHKSNGRAIVIGGDIFYSPNSSTSPALPPPVDSPLNRNPSKDNVAEFQRPRWQTPNAIYLPFIPTSPNFYSPPFHVLFHEPFTRKGNRVEMDSSDTLEWNTLERRLNLSVQSFQSGYAIPSSRMTPIVTTSLACQGTFRYHSEFIAAEKRCRNWFSMWMGMISLGIAVAQAIDGEDPLTPCPRWFHCIVRHVDEGTASGLRQQLSKSGDMYPRSGVFLNLSPMPGKVIMPTVDFYVKSDIPVWYPWGQKEEALLRVNPAAYSRYVPPPHLLQNARSFLVKEPSSVEQDRPWEAFFKERQLRAANIKRPSGRKPPMKVFLWEKDENGKWTRSLVHSREKQTTLKEHGRHQKVFDEGTNEWDCCAAMGDLDPDEKQALDWEDSDDEPILPIGRNMRAAGADGPNPDMASRYLEPSNDPPIWDDSDDEPILPIGRNIRSAGADGRNADMASRYLEPSNVPPISSPPPLYNATSSSSHSISNTGGPGILSMPSPSSSTRPRYAADYDFTGSGSPVDLLRLFYGFVPPKSFRSISIKLPEYKVGGEEAKNFVMGVGMTKIADAYLASPAGQAAINFFWSLSQKDFVPPINELYDLAPANPSYIKKSRRLSFMKKLPSDIFLFHFKDFATVSWSIGVTNAVDALFILRLDPDLDDYQIVHELLYRGVRFVTLVRLPFFTPNIVPKAIPRIRLSGYTFTQEDYELYRLECEEMLRNPRIGRGALQRGGILWRLAIRTVGFGFVLSGPTTSVTVMQQCNPINPGDSILWCDDPLDQSEMDMICGVYHVYTGQGKQQATMSWWPPVQVWDKNMCLGFWSTVAERIYSDRVAEIEAGKAKPLTSEQWRNKIRSFAAVRRASSNNLKAAASFLNALLLPL